MSDKVSSPCFTEMLINYGEWLSATIIWLTIIFAMSELIYRKREKIAEYLQIRATPTAPFRRV